MGAKIALLDELRLPTIGLDHESLEISHESITLHAKGTVRLLAQPVAFNWIGVLSRRGNVILSVGQMSYKNGIPDDDLFRKEVSHVLIRWAIRLARRQDERIFVALNGPPLPRVGTPVPTVLTYHIPSGETGRQYNTYPPTSGPSWRRTADSGIYDSELADEQIAHNLHHGNIVISHNIQDFQQIEQLKRVAQSLPDWGQWLVLRPYSKIAEGEIALSTWGWIQRFQGVDAAGIKEFYLAHYGRGQTFAPC